MLAFSESKDTITISGNRIFIAIGMAAALMTVGGIRVLADTELSFGTLFLGFWCAVTLTMAIVALANGTKQIVINGEGVLCKTWFEKNLMPWEEVQDWGRSYCGQTRGEGNTYYLYFSAHVCCAKNECAKRLKGTMIKTVVIGEEYAEVVRDLVPFCQGHTAVPPFVGEDRHHYF